MFIHMNLSMVHMCFLGTMCEVLSSKPYSDERITYRSSFRSKSLVFTFSKFTKLSHVSQYTYFMSC